MYEMLVKTPEWKDYVEYFEETFKLVRKFDMRLNPDKCILRVQFDKFLGFMITHQSIESNPNKF